MMLVLPCLPLLGCASTGVIPVGDGVFMIAKKSATTTGTGGQVKADLYKEANAYCKQQGKELETIDVTGVDGRPFVRTASAELRFRCK